MRNEMQHREASGVHASEFAPSVVVRELTIGDDVSAFRILNEEWIVHFFSLEAKDREILGDPEGSILRSGGHIFMAFVREEGVGCVALLPSGNGVYELSKMAVRPNLRNQGIGRQLLEHAITEGRRLGAVSLFLATNSKLHNAIHLYERAGFLHVPREQLPPLPYTRADVFMAMTL